MALLGGVWLLGCTPAPVAPPANAAAAIASTAELESQREQSELAEWQQQRMQLLQGENSWLSLTGAGRFSHPGRYRLGHASDNDVILPGGPEHLGLLELGDDSALPRLQLEPGVVAALNGKPVQGSVALRAWSRAGEGDLLRLGSARFYLVGQESGSGWRFGDAHSPTLKSLRAMDYFPERQDWRIVARWKPYQHPHSVILLSSIGTPLRLQVSGEAEFERNGRRFHLYPLDQGPGNALLFLFADRTSGKESYGGGRYLRAAAPQNGRLILDFNRAENPPCAFTDYAICPIAPASNRLDLNVDAGEKVYVPS